MALVDNNWTKTTIHHVASEFLRAERDRFSFYPPWVPVIDNPDLNNPLENHRRLRLLYIKRVMFMVEVPPDTIWWKARLTQDDLDQLYLSARHNSEWDTAGSKLTEVAAVVLEPLKL